MRYEFFLLERGKSCEEAFIKRLKQMLSEGWEMELPHQPTPEIALRMLRNRHWAFLKRAV